MKNDSNVGYPLKRKYRFNASQKLKIGIIQNIKIK